MILEALGDIRGLANVREEKIGAGHEVIHIATFVSTERIGAIGYIAIDAGWCESEYFEGLLRGCGLSFVKSYQMERIYKTRFFPFHNEAIHETKRAERTIEDYFKEAEKKK